MNNFDDITKESIKLHNPNLQKIPDQPYKILIIGSTESGKNKFII